MMYGHDGLQNIGTKYTFMLCKTCVPGSDECKEKEKCFASGRFSMIRAVIFMCPGSSVAYDNRGFAVPQSLRRGFSSCVWPRVCVIE